jgi:endogenous inhibitor of DNA gyrase (YacG/DUF329 family)
MNENNPALKCWNCNKPTTFAVVEDSGRYVPICSDRCERKYDRFMDELEDERGW